MKIKSIVTFAGTKEVIRFRLKRVETKVLYSELLKRHRIVTFHDYNHYYTHYHAI